MSYEPLWWKDLLVHKFCQQSDPGQHYIWPDAVLDTRAQITILAESTKNVFGRKIFFSLLVWLSKIWLHRWKHQMYLLPSIRTPITKGHLRQRSRKMGTNWIIIFGQPISMHSYFFALSRSFHSKVKKRIGMCNVYIKNFGQNCTTPPTIWFVWI